MVIVTDEEVIKYFKEIKDRDDSYPGCINEYGSWGGLQLRGMSELELWISLPEVRKFVNFYTLYLPL